MSSGVSKSDRQTIVSTSLVSVSFLRSAAGHQYSLRSLPVLFGVVPLFTRDRCSVCVPGEGGPSVLYSGGPDVGPPRGPALLFLVRCRHTILQRADLEGAAEAGDRQTDGEFIASNVRAIRHGKEFTGSARANVRPVPHPVRFLLLVQSRCGAPPIDLDISSGTCTHRTGAPCTVTYRFLDPRGLVWKSISLRKTALGGTRVSLRDR